MQNAEVHWDGEPVAVVVAETLEQSGARRVAGVGGVRSRDAGGFV